ncbi:class I SAM-dependent methyltransferase [Niabella drilacis]|uniref:Methyltransferase domain-containing protein n=1 Tax=Niabella drilacis (strain DSM 25811 / CCM 8410 / CCUG 62505 / LMG 26954 / E90) TaxID=1285928 RepID=A0A1G6YCQ3_NIADE|nr:class I SAM-dependent methyltransferase [Niabella drilacis]SDD87773.1 Methyltransferase domain-containing protein [Niabella drilacis]
MIEQQKIIDFYDDYIGYQVRVGINERIYGLYRRMIRLGLNKRSRVLELGCGIGSLTRLLAHCIKQGSIEAVDISPESVAYAGDHLSNAHTRFVTADIVRYTPTLKNIDFITLFDVLEHVPLSLHPALLNNLLKACTPQTKILINIPNPDSLVYDIEQGSEGLQIIDQPVVISTFIKDADQAGLKLDFFETYDIWHKNDYTFIQLSPRSTFEKTDLASRRSLFQKAVKKMQRIYFRTRYR